MGDKEGPATEREVATSQNDQEGVPKKCHLIQILKIKEDYAVYISETRRLDNKEQEKKSC